MSFVGSSNPNIIAINQHSIFTSCSVQHASLATVKKYNKTRLLIEFSDQKFRAFFVYRCINDAQSATTLCWAGSLWLVTGPVSGTLVRAVQSRNANLVESGAGFPRSHLVAVKRSAPAFVEIDIIVVGSYQHDERRPG